MGIESAIRVLNEMQAAKVIETYAIGGAVAAFIYIEPGTTFDLDIFIAWEPGSNGLLDLGGIYGYLMARGYMPEREAIMIEGWAVQFLPTGNDLVREALEKAVPLTIKGEPTRVFTQEHLMAISLQTSRPKDLARLVQFVQEDKFNRSQLNEILNRHELGTKFADFEAKFFEKSSRK